MARLLAAETLTVERRTGAYVAGVWVETSAPLTIRASVQPLDGRELQLLEPGLRSRRTVKIYTDTRLRTARGGEGATPDVVTLADGERLEVHEVHDYSLHRRGMPHYRCILVAIEGDES